MQACISISCQIRHLFYGYVTGKYLPKEPFANVTAEFYERPICHIECITKGNHQSRWMHRRCSSILWRAMNS